MGCCLVFGLTGVVGTAGERRVKIRADCSKALAQTGPHHTLPLTTAITYPAARCWIAALGAASRCRARTDAAVQE